jgi:phosphatidylserine/phosphatidylglycerophosphate/cardiolipin synthase-like enzyme
MRRILAIVLVLVAAAPATVPMPLMASMSVPASAPATIKTCFAPEQDCAAFAIGAIEEARHQILVNAYNLTTGTGIVEALVRARARGVDVRLIADKRTPCERNTGVEVLAAAGTPIWIDRTVPIAHAKTMVIDRALTLMGSYNWTRNAARNSEDLNLVASPAVAAAYAMQWGARRAVSVPFAGREDWCRPRRARNLLAGGN